MTTLTNLLSRINQTVRAEIDDLGGRLWRPTRLSVHLPLDAFPDVVPQTVNGQTILHINPEIAQGICHEIGAETLLRLLLQARGGRPAQEIDVQNVDGVLAQIESIITRAKSRLGEGVLIISPTMVTILQSNGWQRDSTTSSTSQPQGLQTLGRIGQLYGTPVFVDVYASDSTALLFCAAGWIEYTDDPMVQLGEEGIDHHTGERRASFEQPAVLRVDQNKVLVFPVTGMMMLGFL